MFISWHPQPLRSRGYRACGRTKSAALAQAPRPTRRRGRTAARARWSTATRRPRCLSARVPRDRRCRRFLARRAQRDRGMLKITSFQPALTSRCTRAGRIRRRRRGRGSLEDVGGLVGRLVPGRHARASYAKPPTQSAAHNRRLARIRSRLSPMRARGDQPRPGPRHSVRARARHLV